MPRLEFVADISTNSQLAPCQPPPHSLSLLQRRFSSRSNLSLLSSVRFSSICSRSALTLATIHRGDQFSHQRRHHSYFELSPRICWSGTPERGDCRSRRTDERSFGTARWSACACRRSASYAERHLPRRAVRRSYHQFALCTLFSIFDRRLPCKAIADSDYLDQFHGGAKTTVFLCASSTILLTNPIQFTAPFQKLVTHGSPTGSTRATLLVASALQTCAVYGVCTNCAGIELRNVQVNGNRDALGRENDGLALIEFGGNANNVVIDSVRAFDPRGWR